ncbi:RNA polymerase subunit sigma [Limnohabitans sp. TS-CS-82]|uniref:sigma-70 family RNA polymerase sigma factor n=1 Tax=Limnohabitans sp. TS-CS-82 TaxID=2094193 RepID=UPI000CF26166|nr:sigma-70 family RNA polymerase sigma factor [Limnohabitans sp. TS-CS-82]PQA83643.1 RNA polymerase subunit sigma [Limnohabitans sp. TS-CS-82]
MPLDVDETVLASLRGPMLKFARLHLSHSEDAEDCVQDTLLAYWAKPGQFDGRASLKTYLFGILKNKVADKLRGRYRDKWDSPGLGDDDFDVWFTDKGRWEPQEHMSRWAEPEGALVTRQFLEVLDLCLNGLPEKMAVVFSMKELMDMDATEICAHLGVTKDLYWQCMSRARKSIQVCLGKRWFEGASHAV